MLTIDLFGDTCKLEKRENLWVVETVELFKKVRSM